MSLAKCKSYSGSNQGSRHQINDDAIFFSQNDGLFLVCDGVSEGGQGATASQFVAKFLSEFLARSKQKLQSSETKEVKRLHFMQNELIAAFNQAQEGLLKLTQDTNKTSEVCATTALALWVDGSFGLIAHLGDSRAYLVRAGKVYQLTHDHSGFDELVRMGWEVEAAKKHPFANALSKAVGTNLYAHPDLLKIEFQPKDVLLLATDGAYKMLQKNWDQVLKIKEQSQMDALLADAAKDIGDDASAILVQFPEEFENTAPVAASERVNLIQKTPLCRHMDFPQKIQMAALCNIRKLAAGTNLIQEGTEGDTLYVVAHGLLEVSKKSRYVSVVGSGGFVGEMGLIKKIKRTATVAAKQDSIILTLEAADLFEAFTKDPSLESAFYRSITESLLDRILDLQSEQ